MRREKTNTYALLAATLFAVAFAIALIGWMKEHSRLKATLKKTVESQRSHVQEDAIAALTRQTTGDAATIQHLKASLNQKTAEATQFASELKIAKESLAAKQNDDAFLQSRFDELKLRFEREVADESRYYLLYTGWKEVGLNQREYIKGIYIDDLALRNAAKQSPYASFSFSDPESAPSSLPASNSHHPATPVKK